jgi:hypothetical protein
VDSMDGTGGFKPTSQQELLLRAALSPGEKAVEAWQDWKATVDLEQLDSASIRLLPLLYRNLRQLGVEDALMGRFRGIHRLTWYRNQKLFRDMSSVVRSLNDNGVPTMVLKGPALILLHYQDHGLRPVGDVDVLVPTKDARTAAELLTELGWRSRMLKSPDQLTETYLTHRHAQVFKDSAGQRFDLHWHVLADSCGPNADEDFWQGSVPFRLAGVATRALNPTDQLLHVCAHGSRWSAPPAFQWVADAVMVMSSAGSQIDWQRFLWQVRKHRTVLALRDATTYLKDLLDAPVPSAVLQSLQATPVTQLERLEYEARSSPWAARGPWEEFRYKHQRYALMMKVADSPSSLLGFAQFLLSTWGLEHLWQLPLSVVGKVAYRVREMSAWYRSAPKKPYSGG